MEELRPRLTLVPAPPAEETAAYLRVLIHGLTDVFGARAPEVVALKAKLADAIRRAKHEKTLVVG